MEKKKNQSYGAKQKKSIHEFVVGNNLRTEKVTFFYAKISENE